MTPLRNIAAVTAVTERVVNRALLLRIVSGVSLAIIAVAATAIGGTAFLALVVVAVVLMAWEWDRLCGGSGWGLLPAMHAGIVAVTVVLFAVNSPGTATAMGAAGVGVIAVSAVIVKRAPLWAAAGFLCTAVPAAAAIWLRFEVELGAVLILWLFAVIWSTDACAYFTGKALGGAKLAPAISPGKTWSGAVGGLTGAVLAAEFVAWWAGLGPVWLAALAGAVVSVAGQAGDLAISRIKRHFRVKDSSWLIPGHGGVLDRLDSTVSSLPLVAAAVIFLQASKVVWP